MDVLYISSAYLIQVFQKDGPDDPYLFEISHGVNKFYDEESQARGLFSSSAGCELFSTRSDHPINKPGCYSELFKCPRNALVP